MFQDIINWFVNTLGSSAFKLFGDNFVTPVVNAYLQSKNIDVQINKDEDITKLAQSIVEANVQSEQIKEQFASNLLNWWFFRFVLGALLFFPAVHFCMAVADNSLVFFFGKQYGYFDVPLLKGAFASIENQLLLTFVIVHGGGGIVTSILNRLRK